MASETEPSLSIEAAARLLDATEVELKRLSKRGVLPSPVKGKYPLMAMVQRYVNYLREGIVTMEQGAEAIGKSNVWVHKLINAGYIKRQPGGGVRQRDVYEGYIKFLTDEDRRATKTAAESRVRDARAKEIELRVAIREKELMPVEDLMTVLSEQVAMARAQISGLPARVTRDLELRRVIEREIDGFLNGMAERNAKATIALQAGDDALEAGSADTA
jgi:phage terminase Nu1 subunit (DNA packaging protein)